MLHFFRVAIFLGAGLLFLIQPMFAKMVLPMLGGSPAVWNTCMLFFQGVLLAGYAYAHATNKLLGAKPQALLHMIVLIAILFLPAISIPNDWTPPTGTTPIFSLLGLLFIVVGGPFFAVSATSPMLQQWFAATNHERSENPYFLYSASNIGSMIALLSYPFFIERILRLEMQTQVWKYGYILFVIAMGICGYFVLLSKREKSTAENRLSEEVGERANTDIVQQQTIQQQSVTWASRLFWIALSFVPSSWMLGVTTYLTTDISPMPILWIIPLTLYLITFIIAFSDQPFIRYSWVSRAFPIVILILAASTIFNAGIPLMVLHLIAFFVGSMVCHLELAKRKPAAKDLTEFYFWVSFGGLLGGVFNGLVAPILFPWVLEYPITLMVACLLRPTLGSTADSDSQEKVEPSQTLENQNASSSNSKRKKNVGLKTRSKSTTKSTPKTLQKAESQSANEDDDLEAEKKLQLVLFLIFGASVAVMAQVFPFQGTLALTLVAIVSLGLLCACYFMNRPKWFAVPLGLLLIFSQLEPPQAGETVLFTKRGFFGVNRVVDGPSGLQKRLYHGKTVHGLQTTDSSRPELLHEPTSYYHRNGPLGEIFELGQSDRSFKQIGVVGLGAGTAACYWKPGQYFTFFEIDPIVQEIAENTEYFSFLSHCGKENYEIVLGDGRLKLAEIENGRFDLIVFDAFSSDAIPMHLLTKEAIESYQSKLSPNGLLAFHISNQFFDLEPILGDLSEAAELESVTFHDREVTDEEFSTGKAAASYVVMAKQLSATGLPTGNQSNWKPTKKSARGIPWTDDFSNVLDAIK